MPDRSDAADDALRTLYSATPDEFLTRRGELVAAARQRGDAVTARTVEKLRKPTTAAWIVNLLALERPEAVDELIELGTQLRAAQQALDAGRLRELTTDRRSLVSALCQDAFARAARKQPPAALRDEVSGTFDAAIADPEVAARLGRLQRSEQWSGFGFAPGGAPELTLVRGGRSDVSARPSSTRSTPDAPAAPRISAGERRKQQRALAAAQKEFDGADSAHDQARDAEKNLADEVRQLTKKLSNLQSRLDATRADLEAARQEVTETRARRREARSALDRAERDAGD